MSAIRFLSISGNDGTWKQQLTGHLKLQELEQALAREEVVVPMGATQVELWFRNSYQASSRCEAWDSRFGQNYWFNVTPG
jgi:hypothetical protein